MENGAWQVVTDRSVFGKYLMRLRELITEVKIDNRANALFENELDEGWKDWVAGATLGAAALGANAGNIALGNIAYQPVEKGDTIYSIARQNGVSPQEIMKLNGFNNSTKLQLGQQVKVPDNFKDEKPVAKTAPQAQPKSLPKAAAPTVKKAPAGIVVKTVTDNPLEAVLLKTAKAAGLKGAELAAFMAQCQHETLDFKYLKEFGGSLDFRKYDPKYAPRKAKSLGNKHVGDGAKFKGRGFIQITGRYNYKLAGEELGLDLVNHPELAEKPENAAKIAVWFWQHRVQPNVDNFHDVNAVTKPINPGMRGLEDRKENFKTYMQVATSNNGPAGNNI